jgi:hypothetical protein
MQQSMQEIKRKTCFRNLFVGYARPLFCGGYSQRYLALYTFLKALNDYEIYIFLIILVTLMEMQNIFNNLLKWYC